MNALNPTPRERLCDAQGRPYFLWDEEHTTLAQFVSRLDGSDAVKALDVAKLMRQAKPDDVFSFVTPAEIARLWPHIERNLGRTRDLWDAVFSSWEKLGLVAR